MGVILDRIGIIALRLILWLWWLVWFYLFFSIATQPIQEVHRLLSALGNPRLFDLEILGVEPHCPSKQESKTYVEYYF